jgi:hypothetical protein
MDRLTHCILAEMSDVTVAALSSMPSENPRPQQPPQDGASAL